MAKFFDNARFPAKTIHLCVVVMVIGPMCRETASDPNATSVTPIFTYLDSPLWLDTDKSVYFVDGIDSQLIRYSAGTTNAVSLTSLPKFLVHITDQQAFVIGYGTEVKVFPWDGIANDTSISPNNSLVLTTDTNENIECGKADNSGRLWVGTSFMNDSSKGRFYSVDSTGEITPLDITGTPAGITWNVAFDQIYYTDPNKKTIVKCSFNLENGTIGNDGVVVFDFAANGLDSVPNGITVDSGGNLWVACMKSDKVIQINPADGKIITTVSLPGTTSVTSVEFGGDTYNNLYVTTALDQVTGEADNAGKMFEVTGAGATGVGSTSVNVNWPAN